MEKEATEAAEKSGKCAKRQKDILTLYDPESISGERLTTQNEDHFSSIRSKSIATSGREESNKRELYFWVPMEKGLVEISPSRSETQRNERSLLMTINNSAGLGRN